MCGIVGLISKNKSGFEHWSSSLFTQLLQMDSIRGKDSTGVFGVDQQNKIDLLKGDTNAWQFTSCKNYKDFADHIYSKYRIVIGHNRAATTGSVTPHNAHPFKEDNICLVHNGTIYNKDELDKECEVDSHAITKALAKADAVTALNQINGPFALVWFDSNQKTLNLARNNDRPLFLIEYDTFWTIVSEPGLSFWLNGREGRKVVGTPKIVPTEKIIKFQLDDLSAGFTEVDFENYTYVSTPIPVREPYVRNHLSVVKSSAISAGDEIVFKIDDMKHEPGDAYWTIFGNPVFNGEIDANILVKTTKSFQVDADTMLAAGYGIGHVSSVQSVADMTILILSSSLPHTIHIDKNNNTTTDEDIKKAVASGCNKCKGAMSFIDIASSIIRKKKDGTYRTLCKTCLNESIANIPTKKGVLIAN